MPRAAAAALPPPSPGRRARENAFNREVAVVCEHVCSVCALCYIGTSLSVKALCGVKNAGDEGGKKTLPANQKRACVPPSSLGAEKCNVGRPTPKKVNQKKQCVFACGEYKHT